MAGPAPVTLEIFDASGRRVAEQQFGILSTGAHRLQWDGRERHGERGPANLYWVRVRVGHELLVTRVVRLR
jgi:flagellar hook assembly protein FlgD